MAALNFPSELQTKIKELIADGTNFKVEFVDEVTAFGYTYNTKLIFTDKFEDVEFEEWYLEDEYVHCIAL